MEHWAGKIALVTGGATGIGRVTAQCFAKAGATVVVGDVDQGGAEQTAGLIAAAGGLGHVVVADVSSAAGVDVLFAHIDAQWGRLDFACNNAGIAEVPAAWLDVSEDSWHRVLALNLTGVWLCMRAEIRQMLTQGGGSIVNMASIFGLVGGPASPALTASKHGVVGLTKSAALAYAKSGIRVNAVCPSFIETPMLDRLFAQHPEHKEVIAARQPIGRLGTAGEVAETVVWLCSAGAAFITGQALAVDGGFVAQ